MFFKIEACRSDIQRRKENWKCTVWLTVFVVGASPRVAQCFLPSLLQLRQTLVWKSQLGHLSGWETLPASCPPRTNKESGAGLRREESNLTSQRQMGKESKDCLLVLFPFKTKVTSQSWLLCFPPGWLMCLNYPTLYSSQHPSSRYYLIKSISSAAQKWYVLRPKKLAMKWASSRYWL